MKRLKQYISVITKLWRCDGIRNPKLIEERRGVLNFLLEKIYMHEQYGKVEEDEVALVRDRVERLIDKPGAGCVVIRKSI